MINYAITVIKIRRVLKKRYFMRKVCTLRKIHKCPNTCKKKILRHKMYILYFCGTRFIFLDQRAIGFAHTYQHFFFYFSCKKYVMILTLRVFLVL